MLAKGETAPPHSSFLHRKSPIKWAFLRNSSITLRPVRRRL